MMNLSAHFALSEFLFSETAARMGREIVPTPVQIENLTRLCLTLLEPLREELGRPIIITSGLRPVWLNIAIGGSKTSAHPDGRAADLQVHGVAPIEVCRTVQRLQLPVDQCILEFPKSGAGWTHLGIEAAGAKLRGEYLTANVVDGRTKYEVGLNA
jgi:zinc D-Ala-D-Ala carboxypeptidase